MNRFSTVLGGVALAALCVPAHAQTNDNSTAAGSGSLMSDIIVTAQKRSQGELAQDVSISITALDTAQMNALNIRNLADAAALAPNATLDNNGTYRGYANFTIRGSGVNGSVPSVEPAVGLFVNGVYQGIAAGSTNDGFDTQSIQILRGPQGTLFGRNVTGGAVLVETKRPSGEFGGVIQGSIETGPEYSIAGAVDLPLVQDKIDARVAAYYRNDEGWFTNQYDGSKVGKLRTLFVRPTVVFRPTETLTQTFIGEYGETEGDGIVPQAFSLYQQGDWFELNYGDRGATDQDWHSITSETVLDVGFGNGSITNVFGYRAFKSFASLDADGAPAALFRINTYVDQNQISDELRYAGRFGALDLTVGAFFMHQYLLMQDARAPFIAGDRGGGGIQKSDSYGLFAQGTYALTDALSVTAGLRYSYEEKSAIISRLAVGRCLDPRVLCDFAGLPTVDSKRSFDSFSPKLGIDYRVTDDVLLYASFGKAVRSGGYNLRITAAADPGTYDDEKMTSYEIGLKSDLFGRHLRFNVAGFINDYKDMQRIVAQTIGPNVIQFIDNAADARIKGVELEIVASPLDGVEFPINVGYQDANFTEVRGDLNNDGVIDATDLGLRLPRVSKWSASAGVILNKEFGNGSSLRTQVSYAYRSRQAAEDTNLLFFPSRNDLRGSIRYVFPDGDTSISVFGRNILNEVVDASLQVSLPTFASGGIRSLGEGSSFGISFEKNF